MKIETAEEYDNLPEHTYYSYNCKGCGIEQTRMKGCHLYQEGQRKLLCLKCLMRERFREEHGVSRETYPDDIIIDESNVELFDKMVKGQKFQLRCKTCGKLEPFKFLKNRKERFKKLLCKECLSRKGYYDSQESRLMTNYKRYGASHAMKTEKGKELQRNALLEKYGVTASALVPGAYEKHEQTMLEKYGSKYPLQNEAIKEKALKAQAETNHRKYGVPYTIHLEDVEAQTKKTMLERYGQEHAPTKHIKFDGQWFDSNWEVIFYRYWSSIQGAVIKREPCYFNYQYGDETHRYYPDFYVKKPDDTEGLFEVKGDQFFAIKEGKEVMVNPFDHSYDDLFEAKHQCALEHGVIFVRKREIEELKKLLGE